MSTVKATNFQHPSAASPNLVLAADGSVSGGAGLGGLVLVSPTSIANSGGSASASGGAVSFTGVSSVSLNGVFTSSYDNYRIIATYRPTSDSDKTLSIRWRASGTDNTGNFYVTTTGTTGTGYTSSHGLGNAYYSGLTGQYGVDIQVLQPQESAITKSHGGVWAGTAGSILTNSLITYHDSNLQFDGFSLITSTSGLTGTIRVYGYKNS